MARSQASPTSTPFPLGACRPGNVSAGNVSSGNIAIGEPDNLSYHARSTRRKSNTAAEILPEGWHHARCTTGTARHPAGLAARRPRQSGARDYSTGFYYPEHKVRQSTDRSAYFRAWLVVGEVLSWSPEDGGRVTIMSRNKIEAGQEVEFVLPGAAPFAYTVPAGGFRDADGHWVEAINNPAHVFSMPCPQEVPVTRPSLAHEKADAEARIEDGNRKQAFQSQNQGKQDMSSTQYDDAILDSNAIDPTDKNGNPIPVTIPIMLAPGIKVVYTTRLGGTSEGDFAHFNLGGKSGDKPEHVLANRKALADVLGAKISLISQVHSGDAVDVDESFVINQPFGFDVSGTKKPEDETDGENNATGNDGEPTVIEADGQVTSRKNVALGMFAADCLPVLMADPEAGVIGAAHCGRRGLQKGVIGATIEKMVSKGAQPERIVATLGPCICGDCYEVGGDIADEFDAQFPGTFTLSRFGQPGIDIAAAALQELAKAGVPADNIVSSRPRVNAATQYLSEDEELAGICAADGEGDPKLSERFNKIRRSLCTLENPLWFSHRRASLAKKQHEGRMLALIVRE